MSAESKEMDPRLFDHKHKGQIEGRGGCERFLESRKSIPSPKVIKIHFTAPIEDVRNMISEAILVLRLRDGVEITPDQVRERANAIMTGLMGRGLHHRRRVRGRRGDV